MIEVLEAKAVTGVGNVGQFVNLLYDVILEGLENEYSKGYDRTDWQDTVSMVE